MMADEGEGRNGPVEKTDRISRLPDEIKELILGFLPIADAVRSSVLSQKWKFSWPRAGRLNLKFNNEEFMSRDKYCRLIGKILLSHVGMIHKVTLAPLWDDHGDDHVDDLYDEWLTDRKEWRYLEEDIITWLQSLSRKGIKELTINFRRGRDVGFFGMHDDTEKFDPSSSIFHCSGLSSLKLEHCILRNCIAFKGFPYLVKLVLCEVDIYNDILERISSSGPLKMLSLVWCNFKCGKAAISAPKLKVFQLVRAFSERFPCYLKSAPNLKVGLFKMDASQGKVDLLSSNCFDIFMPIPLIEVFAFSCLQHKTSASDTVPQRFTELLVNLKTVILDDFDPGSKDHMSFMLCIIRSSPHLQTLNINMLIEVEPLLETSKVAQKAARANLKIMRKEEIKTSIRMLSLVSGLPKYEPRIKSEVAFFGSIVSCCPILEKLAIKAPSSVKGTIKEKVSKALKQLGQSSTKPKIIFTKSGLQVQRTFYLF